MQARDDKKNESKQDKTKHFKTFILPTMEYSTNI